MKQQQQQQQQLWEEDFISQGRADQKQKENGISTKSKKEKKGNDAECSEKGHYAREEERHTMIRKKCVRTEDTRTHTQVQNIFSLSLSFSPL